jgi:hypothetical protein
MAVVLQAGPAINYRPVFCVACQALHAAQIHRRMIVLNIATTAGAEPAHGDVFKAGTDGYNRYRIPVIEVAPDGSILEKQIRTGKLCHPA